MYPASEPRCPYCHARLDTAPKAKKMCPSCGKFIFVRTRPSDRQRVLMTEQEAKNIGRLPYWKTILSSFGVDEKEYLEIVGELNRRFGRSPSVGDIVWAASNKKLEEAMKRGDWHQMEMIYYNQALFLCAESREFFDVLQEAAKCRLRYYGQSKVGRVEIMTLQDSCDKCKTWGSKQISIEEALNSLPIPVKDCGNGFCRCHYLASPA
jgi:hypothetical protein